MNCSLIESPPGNASLPEEYDLHPSFFRVTPRFKVNNEALCLKCNEGYSLGEDLTCTKSSKGCRIYDSKNKKCLQCLFGWYVNSRFGCSDGKELVSWLVTKSEELCQKRDEAFDRFFGDCGGHNHLCDNHQEGHFKEKEKTGKHDFGK